MFPLSLFLMLHLCQRLAYLYALIWQVQSIVITSVTQQESLSYHSSINLMPFHTVDSILPLPSFSPYTFGYQSSISPTIDINQVYHIPISNSSEIPTASINELHAAQFTNNPTKLIKPALVQNKPINTSTPLASENQMNVITIKELPDEIHLPSCYKKNKKVSFSQYWIPKENEWDETNGGKRVYLGGSLKKRLMDKDNHEIGMVPVDMYEKCRMEGTVR